MPAPVEASETSLREFTAGHNRFAFFAGFGSGMGGLRC
jgi:hypothetical protein